MIKIKNNSGKLALDILSDKKMNQNKKKIILKMNLKMLNKI